MRRLGQHFLRSSAVSQKIVSALNVSRAGEFIIEIGGGHGELTAPLEYTARKSGVVPVVIEKDLQLVAELRKRFPRLRIEEGDVRRVLAPLIHGLKPKRYKLIGNLPYYLTAFLLRQISELKSKPTECVFMVQKEVAERIAARPPRMNKLAASVQFWAEPKILFTVPRESFSPPPEVDSAVIKLTAKKPAGGEEQYFRLVKAIFAQPRQTILNNLGRGLENVPKSELISVLKKAGLEPGARGQNASVEQIELLAMELSGRR